MLCYKVSFKLVALYFVVTLTIWHLTNLRLSIMRNCVWLIVVKHFHSVCLCVCGQIVFQAVPWLAWLRQLVTSVSMWRPWFIHWPFCLGFVVEMSSGPGFYLGTKSSYVSIISTVPFAFIYHLFYVNNNWQHC
jgi:hypothetical protein